NYNTDFALACACFDYTGNIGFFDRKKKEFFAATKSILGDEWMGWLFNSYSNLAVSSIGDIIAMDLARDKAAFYPGKQLFKALAEDPEVLGRRPVDESDIWDLYGTIRSTVSPELIGKLNKPSSAAIQPEVYFPLSLSGGVIEGDKTDKGAQLDFMIFSRQDIKAIEVFQVEANGNFKPLQFNGTDLEWAQKYDRFWELIINDTINGQLNLGNQDSGKIKLSFKVTLDNGAVLNLGGAAEIKQIKPILPPIVNLELEGTGDSQEEIPGGFIMLNDDDDDKDGKADNDSAQPVNNEDDLVKLIIKPVDPEAEYSGSVTLKITQGASKIKIWDSKTKNNEITLPQTYSTPTDLPKELWVEGAELSGADRDVELVLEYNNSGTIIDDKINLTVVRVDLAIDSNNDEKINTDDNLIEDEKPGCIIPKDLAGDTPEGSSIIKDYLKPMELKVELAGDDTQVVLEADSGLKIWVDSNKATEIKLPKTYDFPAVLPAKVYVDGVTKGSNNIKLTYKFKDGREIAKDEVKVLVVEIPSWSPAKSKIAYVWAPLKTNANGNSGNNLGWGDGDEFENQIKDQGWQVVWFEDTTGDTDDNFGTCSIANYKNMANCGIFTVVSHGEAGAHLAVYAEYSAAGSTAIDNWINGQTDMTRELIPPDPLDPKWSQGCYYARVSSKWLSANWLVALNSHKAIALWSICYSASASATEGAVKEAAGGRWRSGYKNPTNESEAKGVNKKFLERMNGTTDLAKKRTAGEAYDGGIGYTANLAMKGNNWTILCPAPMVDDAVFPEPSVDKRKGWGCVIFDTYMNDTVSADSALKKLSGGNTSNHRWAGNSYGKFILGFDYEEGQNILTEMQAVGKECRNSDPDGGRRLDGDRIKPNDVDTKPDNKEWSF
ncbi:MAG: hypothetical protein V1709_11785, partial [Planctomycetota bacterium]